MKMPFNEICDKYTIAELKLSNLKKGDATETEKRNIEFQRTEYADEMLRIDKQLKPEEQELFDIMIKDLYDANHKIWNAEYEIRKGLEDKLGLEECGRRLIRCRTANKDRVRIKNEISKLVGEDKWTDVKINHASGN